MRFAQDSYGGTATDVAVYPHEVRYKLYLMLSVA
jgi:hypothetical protein